MCISDVEAPFRGFVKRGNATFVYPVATCGVFAR